jgi:hypothetical protein
VFNDASALASGYINTDVDGSNFTDATNLIIVFNNANAVMSVIDP